MFYARDKGPLNSLQTDLYVPIHSTQPTNQPTESGIRIFGQWLASEEWKELANQSYPNENVQHFNNTIQSKMNKYFPEKSIKMSSQDLPFKNWKLKNMKRKLQRLYRKGDRRQEYENLLIEYHNKF